MDRLRSRMKETKEKKSMSLKIEQQKSPNLNRKWT